MAYCNIPSAAIHFDREAEKHFPHCGTKPWMREHKTFGRVPIHRSRGTCRCRCLSSTGRAWER